MRYLEHTYPKTSSVDTYSLFYLAPLYGGGGPIRILQALGCCDWSRIEHVTQGNCGPPPHPHTYNLTFVGVSSTETLQTIRMKGVLQLWKEGRREGGKA